MVIIIVIFSFINIMFADIDALIIKHGQEIEHWKNGLIYCIMLAVAFLIYQNWYLVAALCFDRLIFFNIALNRFRGLPTFYVSKNPKSVIDKIFKPLREYQYYLFIILFILFTILSF